MAGYTRQSAGDIITGGTIQASHFNTEYNQLQNAFDATSGHAHDGTVGGGAALATTALGSLTSTSAGMIVADGAADFLVRELTGTANEITITDGTGVSGNPTVSIPTAVTLTGKTLTGGTFTGGTFDGATITGGSISAEGLEVSDTTDTTKIAQFDVSGVTTGNTRILTIPDADGIVALLSDLTDGYQPLDSTLESFADYNTNGLLTQTAADTFVGRTLTGTAGTITVSNGDGVSGNPTVTIDAAYIGQTSITSVGTIDTGTWEGTTVDIAQGGTGETTANAAFNAFAPSQTSNLGKFLTTDGTNTAWEVVPNSDITITSFAETVLDDADAASIRTTLELGTAATLDTNDLISGHGQCRLTLNGSDLTLSPYNGNRLIIEGTAETISAGVTLVATGLTANTLYYIYAYMNGATMTLEASTTGHSTHTDGVEIKTGDSTRTLVGMARPTTGPAWIDDINNRLVASWFNRRKRYSKAGFTANRNLSVVTPAEINTEIRSGILSWGDSLDFNTAGFASNAVATGAAVYTEINLDGTTNITRIAHNSVSANRVQNHSCPAAIDSVSEGYHYVTLFGATDGGISGTWYGGFQLGVTATI